MNRNTPEEAIERRSTPFGDALHALRTERGWTPAQLAEKTHFSRGHLVNVENGIRRPSKQLAAACDAAFGSGDRLQQLVPTPQPRGTRLALRPMQLPPMPGVFVGRVKELGELDQRLRVRSRGAIVAVYGPAGIGKTWLGLRWAHRVRNSYPDGFLYVDLHGNAGAAAHASSAAVLHDWLVALGVPQAQIPGGLTARTALFRSAMDGRRAVVVIDNAATADQVRSLLPGGVTSSVLITSRSRLTDLSVRDGVTLLSMPEMSVEESIELLRAILGSDRVDGQLDAARALAAQCGHLPGRLRLAAELAVTQRSLTLMDLARRVARDHAQTTTVVPAVAADRGVDDPSRRPREDDVNKPSVSRVYNSYLGDSQNFAADREFANRARDLIPDVHELALDNRAFLVRAVRYLANEGIDQFIDIGAGLPHQSSTHVVARAVNPTCRVLYIDNEAVTVEGLREAVADQAGLAAAQMDFRDLVTAYPNLETLARDAFDNSVIDPQRPVALIMGLLLHFVRDEDDPAATLADYREAIAPSSYVVVSHDTADGRELEMRQFAALYAETNRQLILRDYTELTRLFRDYVWIEPGITRMTLWRPDPDTRKPAQPEESPVYVGVARTPGRSVHRRWA